MNPEILFNLANTLALAGWLLLLILPRWRHTGVLVSSGAVFLLAVLYASLVVTHADGFRSGGGFGSLAQVSLLFHNPHLVLIGWIHYLAFDLFTGLAMTRDSQRLGLSRWAVAPCLILTFSLGPCGWLSYALLRVWKTRSWLKDPF